MVHRLNDLTRDQIQQIIEDIKPTERNCRWCGKGVLMRSDQIYCSARCRAAYARVKGQLAYENAVREKAAWLIERESLIKEIATLRHQLEEKDA